MPNTPKANPFHSHSSDPQAGNAQARETSIRQLLANGNSKAALESAKQFHKDQHTAVTESLLLEAYKARIQSLLDQNLASEAKALLELVEGRFPNAKNLLNDVGEVAAARTGDIAELVQPLKDPELDAERRASIEQIIQTQVTDLRALADCAALPPEHSMRQAAAALDRAFEAVTSAPVNEEQLSLPEVSHRSPLAPWKLLIRAIAHLHRGEDQQCRDCLSSVKPESVPARLVPAMHAILDAKTNVSSLKPAERALVSAISGNLADLRSALEQVDRAFGGESEGPIHKALHAAIRECQRSAPDRLGTLKQITHVRGGVDRLDPKRLVTALDGEPRRDAAYFRMFARALEVSAQGDPHDLAEACQLWDEYRQHALREGLFTAQSIEVAVLYLHIADTLDEIPRQFLRNLQKFSESGRQGRSGDDRFYLYPEKLFARACVIDPHPQSFSKWLSWANGQSLKQGETVAKEWHKIRPGDIEPLLHLMKEAEKRNAFPTALGYLEKAERIDAVHSVVRAARLRLLAAAALSQMQKKKPHLAIQRIAEMAELPQSQQGDKPALLAALRAVNCAITVDNEGVLRSAEEAEARLGRLPATLLLFGVAAAAKQLHLFSLPKAQTASQSTQELIPAALARVMAIAKDFGLKSFSLPLDYIVETEKQLPRVAQGLDVEQIRAIGELGIANGNLKLAWVASTEGLKRTGPTQAAFLLLRAQAMIPGMEDRQMVLAAAAAELARFHRDASVLDQAVEILRDPFEDNSLSLTVEQALEVARKETTFAAYPRPFESGPDYSELLPERLCQCADCRRSRGESPDPFDFDDEDPPDEDDIEDFLDLDETEMKSMFKQGLPKGTPPEIADSLFGVLQEALRTGESPEKLLADLLGGAGGSKQKKGKRKK